MTRATRTAFFQHSHQSSVRYPLIPPPWDLPRCGAVLWVGPESAGPGNAGNDHSRFTQQQLKLLAQLRFSQKCTHATSLKRLGYPTRLHCGPAMIWPQ